MFFGVFQVRIETYNFVCFPAGMKYVQVSWHLWSYSVMPTVKIGALFCPKYIKTSIIFSGNAQSFRGLRPLDPHQGLAPGPHRGPKAGPWTPPVMGFAPRRSPCTLCVHQIFSQFLYNFGQATFKSWLTPWFWIKLSCIFLAHNYGFIIEKIFRNTIRWIRVCFKIPLSCLWAKKIGDLLPGYFSVTLTYAACVSFLKGKWFFKLANM